MADRNFAITKFITTTAGTPFLLLPFGPLVKNGRVIEITRELAAKFKLPHFKPPIKLGSHDDETPAGGHIIGLQVGEDGLYAIPEWNPRGTSSLELGEYRYNSPEIIWEGGGYEDPVTGDSIPGPLIVGDALLHTPHLGERTALYTAVETPVSEAENLERGNIMTDQIETLSVPASVFDRIFDFVDRVMIGHEPAAETHLSATQVGDEPTPDPEDNPLVEELTAVATERDDLRAQRDQYLAEIEAMRTETARAERVAHFSAELAETGVSGDQDLMVLLAGIDEEAANEIVRRFTALSNQINESALTSDIGQNSRSEYQNPAEEANDLITARMTSAGIDYNSALAMVRDERPELFQIEYRR